MKNALITTMMLKSYGLSLLNRGEDGFGKQGVYGGVNRARISSQCLKKALRKEGVLNDNIRTTHLEDLIAKMLMELTSKGAIEEKDIDVYGEIICEKLGCSWSKKDGQGKSDDKGRTMVVASFSEVLAVVNAVTSINAADKKAIDKAVADTLKSTRISNEKAMFGTMTTAGDLDSVDGAVQVGQSFSIDEYLPENDYIAATFEAGNADTSDPFYGSLCDFSKDRRASNGSETLAESWMNANVMFTPSCVNVGELMRNLSQSIKHTELDISEDILLSDTQEALVDFLENLPLTDPSAKQNSCSSHPAPAIYYLEFIRNGNVQYADFEEVIRRTPDKCITRQGIEKMLEFAKDTTFRRGEIDRYVMLAAPYKDMEEEFETAGIKVIHNLNELETVIRAETERLAKS